MSDLIVGVPLDDLDDDDGLAEIVEARARARDGVLTLRYECVSEPCPVEDIVIRVNDGERTLVPLLARREPRCPICGRRTLGFWRVQTSDEPD
jgi:hypothetical protein